MYFSLSLLLSLFEISYTIILFIDEIFALPFDNIHIRNGLSTGVGIVCLQEPFIGNRSITHSALNFYWPGGQRTEVRVLTAAKKELVKKVIVENRTNMGDHPYFLALNIRDMDSQAKKPGRRTMVINAYDNRAGQECTWEGNTPRNRRKLEDIIWDRVIRGRVLLLGDINTQSPTWNPRCRRKKNTKPLEDIIEKFDSLINNESGRATRPASNGVSIIDLALTTAELRFLTLWEIPKDHPNLSDHELILLTWEEIDYKLPENRTAEPTG